MFMHIRRAPKLFECFECRVTASAAYIDPYYLTALSVVSTPETSFSSCSVRCRRDDPSRLSARRRCAFRRCCVQPTLPSKSVRAVARRRLYSWRDRALMPASASAHFGSREWQWLSFYL
eukprot:541760-Pleurochrysis_carterae.AAC.3